MRRGSLALAALLLCLVGVPAIGQVPPPPAAMTPEQAQDAAIADLDLPPVATTNAGIDAQVAEAEAILATCDLTKAEDADADRCPTAAMWLSYLGGRTNRPAVQARGLGALVAMVSVVLGPESEAADTLRIQYTRILILLRRTEDAKAQLVLLHASLAKPEKAVSAVRAELGLADAELSLVLGQQDVARRTLVTLLSDIDEGRVVFPDRASLARGTMLALSNLALIQLMSGDPKGVTDIAARAIAVHNEVPQSLDGVAMVYACWSMALLYDSDGAGALEKAQLAMAAAEQRGVRDLAYALALQSSALSKANLGDIRAAEEELRGSIAILQEWNTGYPWHKLVNVLAQTLLAQGRGDEAERMVQLALESTQDGELYYTLGLIQQTRFDMPGAVEALVKARALLPPAGGTPGERSIRMAVESALATSYLMTEREAEADAIYATLGDQLGDDAIPVKVRMQAAVAIGTRAMSLGDYASAAKIFGSAEQYLTATTRPGSIELVWTRAAAGLSDAINGDVVEGWRKLSKSAREASDNLAAAKDFDEASRQQLRMLSPIFRWQVMVAHRLGSIQEEVEAASAAADAADALQDAADDRK